jgi:hypothetical protein
MKLAMNLKAYTENRKDEKEITNLLLNIKTFYGRN